MADTPLTRPSQSALTHYKDQAATLRRQAAIARARAHHQDDTQRLQTMTWADDTDAQAVLWEALATELEAFADAQATPPGPALL